MINGKERAELKREIGLVMLVLYGLGITIGAGIYVLVGTAAGTAGFQTPGAFFVAALVMGFSAFSFAEFVGRIPTAAGEAVYVKSGFNSKTMELVTGGLILAAAVIAGAAIAIGSAGYIGTLVPAPGWVLTGFVILSMGAIAAMGVKSAVGIAAVLTVVEILGLLAIVAAGFWTAPDLVTYIPGSFPAPSELTSSPGFIAAALIAFFAFIGFDDIVHMVEETRNPMTVMPRAIIISLVAVTVIYFLVALVAVRAVPLEDIADNPAPMRLLFERLTGFDPLLITLIAILATINGVVIEIVVAARVLYGLARDGRLPAFFGDVNPRSHAPLKATLAVVATMLVLAYFVPLDWLVELTSTGMLLVFFLVNVALIIVKLRGDPLSEGAYRVHIIMPIIGTLGCGSFLIGAWIL